MWNCRGWSIKTNDNSTFRKKVLEYSYCDILAICETFLRGNEFLSIDGFRFYGQNRQNIHSRANRGSGGVSFLIRNELLNLFDVKVIDDDIEGILWLDFESRMAISDNFCVAVCYLPPSETCNPVDPELFFQSLLRQVYCYQHKGNIIICGDFNPRIGVHTDYIEGVDQIKHRNVIDVIENKNGDSLVNFLSDVNYGILNGRFNDNEFTCVSTKGRSVVDYMCVPHEYLDNVKDFKIISMTDI